MKYILILISALTLNTYAWNISPMSQDIKFGVRTFQIKINNQDGLTPLAIKLKTASRDININGDEKLSNTYDLLIFPKQILVAAGKKMVARISVRMPNTSNNEKPYRLIVEQIPVKNGKKSGVQVLTKYLASIYLQPKKSKITDFNINSATLTKNGVIIKMTNNGNYHKVLLPSSLTIGLQKFTNKLKVVNILPQQTINMVLPLNNNKIKIGDILSFDNTCMNCKKGERYEVAIQ